MGRWDRRLDREACFRTDCATRTLAWSSDGRVEERENPRLIRDEYDGDPQRHADRTPSPRPWRDEEGGAQEKKGVHAIASIDDVQTPAGRTEVPCSRCHASCAIEKSATKAPARR